jgi:cytochrome c oxidase cbb3-type subunit 2
VVHVLALVASVVLAAPPATFERACAACHGTSAKGNGPGAADLSPRPRDLTAGVFRFRDIERTIRRGLPGSAMPAFDGLLSDAEIAELVAFIGSLSTEPPPAPITIPTIPPGTPDSIRAGRALYTLLECWKCHGEKGDGQGPSAKGLVDDAGRPIRATDFRNDPLKGGRSPSDVARAILTGLNGSPMPSYGDALLFPSDDQPDPSSLGPEARTALRDARLASLVHYVLSLDKRSGFWSIVFRQKPEAEPR